MTDKETELRGEQQAVDLAYELLESKIRERRELLQTQGRDVTDAKAGTSFIRDVPPELEQQDEELGDAALVYRRFDVVDEDPGGCRTFYIGRRVVRDSDGDAFVISWNARAVKDWMLARPDDPGEVLLRRDLRCDRRRVTGFFDEIGPRSSADAVGTVEGEGVVPVERVELQDFLLEDLRRARDGEMRDIVETIQREQFILVSDERPGLLVVQGGPGTGKTAVGLHRISWLLFNDAFQADEVLVVGPHRGFLDYVRQVLPRLGTRGVRSVELARLWDGEVLGTDTPEARRVKANPRMAEVLRRAINRLVNVKSVESRAARSIRIGEHPDRHVLSMALIERLARPEGVRVPYAVRRRNFIDGLVDHLLRAHAAATPGQRPDDGLRKVIQSDRQVSRLVDRVFPQLSAEELLRSLLRGKNALRGAAASILSDEEQAAITRPLAARVSEEPWTLEDLVCLEEIRHLMTGEPPQRYRHIVVDEAQDLTPMQARSLARRCPTGSMTILGDLAQATGIHQYAGWQELAGQLGAQSGGHLAELTIGYRVPREVMEFAAPLAVHVSPDTALPTSVRPPAAENPVTIVTSTRTGLVDEAIEHVLALPSSDGKRARSIALIVPDGTELLPAARDRIAAEQLDSMVSVLTAAETKGLEFDHVVVLEPAALASQGEAGLRQLYVAITRCTQTLTLVHSIPLPSVLRTDLEVTGIEPISEGDQPEDVLTVGTSSFLILSAPVARDDAVRGLQELLQTQVFEDRKSSVHEYVRYALIAELFREGLAPEVDSPIIDVACQGQSGRFLYEVVGEGGHTFLGMREGAARISDLEYAEGKQADKRFLVLPQEPEAKWAVDTISDRHDVSVIWRTTSGWAGENVDIALGCPRN